jgi:hypothetical protein
MTKKLLLRLDENFSHEKCLLIKEVPKITGNVQVLILFFLFEKLHIFLLNLIYNELINEYNILVE